MSHSKKHRKAISRGLKAYHRKRGNKHSNYEKKYSLSQRRAHQKSRTSKSGHKSWRERQKESKSGLWSNYWKAKDRKKRARK